MLPIDIGVVAAAAVPFITKSADAFSKTAGEKLAGKVVELYQTIESKFKGDSYAEQTLARAREKPNSEDRQIALKSILAEKMEADQNFLGKVTNQLDEIQKEHGSIHTVFDQRGQMVHGSQTNISGSVQGNVLSGTFSNHVYTEKSK
jgi:hypothetical protein